MASVTSPDYSGEPGHEQSGSGSEMTKKAMPSEQESARRHSMPDSSRTKQQQQQQLNNSRSHSRHSMHSIMTPHVSQTAEQRPDEKLIKHQYKAQLQRQIDERKRLKEERQSLEKQEEEMLQKRVEEERKKMAMEQKEELERRRLRDEVIRQREESTLKQIEASRRRAEEERRKRLEQKRKSATSDDCEHEPATATASKSSCNSIAAEFDLRDSSGEVPMPEWKSRPAYSNPHDEQVIKPNPIDFEKMLESQLKAGGKYKSDANVDQDDEEIDCDEDGDGDGDANSLSTYYAKGDHAKSGLDDEEDGVGVTDNDNGDDSSASSCVSLSASAPTPPRSRTSRTIVSGMGTGKGCCSCSCPTPALALAPVPATTNKKYSTSVAGLRAQAFLQKLKGALAREEERMRAIINKRAAAVECDSESESSNSRTVTGAEAEAEETELIYDCSLTEGQKSSSESDAMLA